MSVEFIDASSTWRDVELIRKFSPLVHNITNYVVMNLTANALLAIGASPVMAHAEEEVEEMTGLASALVINIGTLSKLWVESMFKAARQAAKAGLPVVLDPVGAGATGFRTATARAFLEEKLPTIVRGNASEIRALISEDNKTKGVDSLHASDEAIEAARAVSIKHNCVVSVSGAVDYIVNHDRIIKVANGHPLMPRVTGMGCVASALTGAFAAVNSSPLTAASHAMIVMGIAGEIAAEKSCAPGTYQPAFMDALFNLSEIQVKNYIKVSRAEK